MSQQLATGVRDSTNHIHRGADAIAYLRSEMEGASGASAEFTSRMNDTYAGQRAMLTASTNALGIVIGEGFEAALKPAISMLNRVVGFMVNIFDQMPSELRTMIAQFVLWGGVVATAFGTFIAGKAIFALLAPFVGSLTTAFVGLLVSLAPIALAFGAIMAVGYAFNRYISSNEDRQRGWWTTLERVKLGFQGLMQVLSTGRLRGSVLEALNRPNMAGVKSFVAGVASFAFRIMQFFRGIKIGFDSAIDTMGPALDRFTGAFSRLGGYIDSIFGAQGNSLIAGSSARYAEWGSRVGDALGFIVEMLVNIGTAVVNFTTGFIGGFRTVWDVMGPTITMARTQFGLLWESLVKLGQSLGIVGDEVGTAGGGFETFGQGIGGIVAGSLSTFIGMLGVAATVIQSVVDYTTWGITKISQLFNFFTDLNTRIAESFYNVKTYILDLVDTAIIKISELMSSIPVGLRPAWASEAITNGNNVASRRLAARGSEQTRVGAAFEAMRTDGPSGAAARQSAQGNASSNQTANGIAALLKRQATERTNRAAPTTVNLVVDSQVLATVTANANANDREREFSPGGS